MKLKLSDVARDIIGISGVALTVYGAWLVYPPAGFILLGILLLTGAWLSGRAG